MSGRIIVHSLAEAAAAVEAAAALALPVTLASAPGAGAYAGALWFKALLAAAAVAQPAITVSGVLDCGEEAGAVLAALRLGLRHLRFTGTPVIHAKLQAIAAASGAVVEGDIPVPCLDLGHERDPRAAARAFLATGETPG